MIAGAQAKILLTQLENSFIIDTSFIDTFIESDRNWKLVREADSLVKFSKDIKWINWKEENIFKKLCEDIDIGYSLLMSPFNDHFTWQTTQVVEILEKKYNYIKFTTKNSTYELFKL
jgi:hypothetical protein